jgi:glycosyltransferase involved in cell wall biosynthesis
MMRVITRLNIGGPAQQAAALSEELARLGWETLLAIGTPEPSEGNMEHLLAQRNIRWTRIPWMRRGLHPVRDFLAWGVLLRTLLAEKPQILHTHTAKAGALGRSAGITYRILSRKPLKMVHTYHGHVLTDYFSPVASSVFRTIERSLALFTDCLIAVSPLVRDDLVRLRVAPQEKIRVVPLGFPLQHLKAVGPPPEEGPPAVGIVGRLVPVKNHTLFF